MAEPERDFELDRVIFFSDAVFAIAITLVALTLPVPQLGKHATEMSFINALTNEENNLLAYVISFAVISLFWLSHHRIFALITSWKRGLLIRNLAFLLLIAMLPWPTQILARYGSLRGPTILYASVVSGCGLTLFWTWHYAIRNRLTAEAVSPQALRFGYARALIAPLVFLASIPIAFLSPTIAQYSWIAIIPVEFAVESWQHRKGGPLPMSSDDVARVRGNRIQGG